MRQAKVPGLNLSSSIEIIDDLNASQRSDRQPIVSKAAQAALNKAKLNSSMTSKDMKTALNSARKQ